MSPAARRARKGVLTLLLADRPESFSLPPDRQVYPGKLERAGWSCTRLERGLKHPSSIAAASSMREFTKAPSVQPGEQPGPSFPTQTGSTACLAKTLNRLIGTPRWSRMRRAQTAAPGPPHARVQVRGGLSAFEIKPFPSPGAAEPICSWTRRNCIGMSRCFDSEFVVRQVVVRFRSRFCLRFGPRFESVSAFDLALDGAA